MSENNDWSMDGNMLSIEIWSILLHRSSYFAMFTLWYRHILPALCAVPPGTIPLTSSFYSFLALPVLSTRRILTSMLGKERKEKNANEHTYDILILQYTLPIKYTISNFLKRSAYKGWSRASLFSLVFEYVWISD